MEPKFTIPGTTSTSSYNRHFTNTHSDAMDGQVEESARVKAMKCTLCKDKCCKNNATFDNHRIVRDRGQGDIIKRKTKRFTT